MEATAAILKGARNVFSPTLPAGWTAADVEMFGMRVVCGNAEIGYLGAIVQQYPMWHAVQMRADFSIAADDARAEALGLNLERLRS